MHVPPLKQGLSSQHLLLHGWFAHALCVLKKRRDNFQKCNFRSYNSEFLHKAKIVNDTLSIYPNVRQGVKSYCVYSCTPPFPFLPLTLFRMHFIAIVLCSTRRNKDCVVVNERLTLPETMFFSLPHHWICGSVHTYPEICESANFFLRIRLASTRIQRIFRPYPEIFENALQSGNFCGRSYPQICEYATPFSWIQSSRRAL